MMKKFFLGAMALVAACAMSTSCSGGEQSQVNNDSIVSPELCDSLSIVLGQFTGANLNDDVKGLKNIDEFIEGYQLIAGHEYSAEKLMGMTAAMNAAQQFHMMAMDGVNIDRDTFMREFRKYITQEELSTEEFSKLYATVEQLYRRVGEIIQRRDQMRKQVDAKNVQPVTLPDSVLVDSLNADIDPAVSIEEVVETETAVEAEPADVL